MVCTDKTIPTAEVLKYKNNWAGKRVKKTRKPNGYDTSVFANDAAIRDEFNEK